VADNSLPIAAELILKGEKWAKQIDAEISRAQNSGKRFAASIQREIDTINGTRATKQLEVMGLALKQMGGIATVTGQNLDNLRARVEALTRAGGKLPSALAGIGSGSSIGATLGTNIQQQAFGSLQTQLGPLGGLLNGISGSALAAGAAVGGLAIAAGAAAKATAEAVREFATFSGHLTDLSHQTGIGTTALQELSFAGSFTGNTLDEITSAVGHMQRAIAEGDTVFARLGLNLEELAEKSPDEQLRDVAKAITAIDDPARKTAAAVEVFKKSGAGLIPFLRDLENLSAEGHNLGAVFGEEVVASGDRLDDAFNRLDKATQGLGRSLGSLGANTGFITFLENLAANIGLVSNNLPSFISLLERVAPLLGFAGLSSTITQFEFLADIIGKISGGPAGGRVVDPEAAAKAARAALDARSFETQQEEAKREAARKKALQESEAAAKKFQEALRDARIEAFELAKQIEDVGDEAQQGLGNALFGLSTQGQLALPDATINVSPEDMAAAEEGTRRVERALVAKSAAEAKAKKEADEHAAAIQALIGRLVSAAAALSQLPALFDAIGVSADSGLGKAVSAISDVGQSALGFGATLLDPSANIFDKIGAGAQLATSAIKAIGSIFGKSDVEKAGEIAGRTLGTGISEGLAESISELAKELDISKEMASLLELGPAMDESADSASSFAGEMNNLLEAIALGSVPVAEGIESMGEAFSNLADEAAEGSVQAQAAMGALVQRTKELGLAIPELDEAVRGLVDASAGALGGIGGIKLVDEADARAQAQIFLNVFNSVLATDGIVAAAKALQPALKTFQEQLSGAGIDKGIADSILGPIRGALSLLKNDMTKGGAEGAQALKTILESQLSAGFLDVSTFAAIQQQAGTAFDQMIEGGASTSAALQAIAPLLAQIQQTAQATGQAIDPVVQGLIDTAAASGISFPTEPLQQMVTLLGQVVTLLGGIPNALNNLSNTDIKIPITLDPTNTDFSFDKTEGFAGGTHGKRNFGPVSYVPLHGVEAVVPAREYDALVAAASRGLQPMSVSYAPVVNVNGSQLSGPELQRAITRAIQTGEGGVRTAILQAVQGQV
jgi:hypothetical protein